MSADEELVVRPVRSRRDWRAFHRVRRQIYRHDPHAVLPLVRDERLALAPEAHPFYEHAEREVFLCWRDGRPVGRIAAIYDRLHHEHYGDDIGFFGFFETPDEPHVARVLLEAAQAWLVDRGCGTMRGPASPSMKGEFGVQVSGHQDPPYVMMAHTPAYYDTLLDKLGFQVAKTFYAFRYDSDVLSRTQTRYEDVSRVCERIAQRHPELRVRTVDVRHLTHEIHRVNQLANRVRVPVWGFVPLTDAELEHMANELRRVLDPRLFVLAEREKELVGYLIAVPDPNWALRRTVGSADFLRIPQVLFWLRRTPRVRVFALGAHEKYRHAGVTALLLKRMFDEGVSWVREAELSWVVEDNLRSLRAIQRLMPAKQYKSYRLYDRAMGPF